MMGYIIHNNQSGRWLVVVSADICLDDGLDMYWLEMLGICWLGICADRCGDIC